MPAEPRPCPGRCEAQDAEVTGGGRGGFGGALGRGRRGTHLDTLPQAVHQARSHSGPRRVGEPSAELALREGSFNQHLSPRRGLTCLGAVLSFLRVDTEGHIIGAQ